jgi:predicted enzyme related to lactoylglutathione lyase
MPRVVSVRGVVLFANRPDMLARWYRAALGIPFAKATGIDSWCAEMATDVSGAPLLVSINPSREPVANHPGSVMLTCAVDDLRAVAEHLTRHGVPIQRSQETAQGTFLYILDPEGHVIELCGTSGRREPGTTALN